MPDNTKSTHAAPPTGEVTFLFTDIVGSTEMWEQHGDAFLPVLQAHNAILDAAVSQFGGYLFKSEGDAYKVAFPNPSAAVNCAVAAQSLLQRYPWPSDIGRVRVRMGLHTGKPFMQANDYFGPSLSRCARILSAAHGDQVLISEETLEKTDEASRRQLRFTDQGHHRLRDLDEPIRLYQAEHSTLQEVNFPPVRSLNAHAHNLPVQRTSFIGREKEIERIAELLGNSDTPVLTVTGPRGVGKTRLSLQVAAERVELFPDGVWFVRLSSATDLQGAAVEIAKTLGVRLEPGISPIATVRKWLHDRRCLLILDDCGNVPQAGTLIRELLTGSSSLRCLATSRESLQIDAQAELEIGGLALPPEEPSTTELMQSESGRLFVEEAAAARGDFPLTDRRSALVGRVVRELKGSPGLIAKAARMIGVDQQSAQKVIETLTREVASGAEELRRTAADGLQRLKKLAEEAEQTVPNRLGAADEAKSEGR
jgi:class 3 adenylate cyclase